MVEKEHEQQPKNFEEVSHRFSVSQLNMYANCGVSYFYKYVENIRPPIPSHNMTIGSLVHALVEESYRIKESTPEVNWSDPDFWGIATSILSILTLPPQDYLEEWQEPGLKYPDPDTVPPIVVKGEDLADYVESALVNIGMQVLIDRAQDAIGWTDEDIAEATEIISKTLPVYVRSDVFKNTDPKDDIELQLEFTLAEQPFVGYVDFIDHSNPKEPILIDLKTAKRKYADNKITQDIQLLVYAYAFHQIRGIWPGIAYHVLIKKKTPEIQVQTLSSEEVQQEWGKVEQRVRALLHGIQSAVWLPAPPGSWICNEKWCPYYDSCPYVQGTGDDNGADQ